MLSQVCQTHPRPKESEVPKPPSEGRVYQYLTHYDEETKSPVHVRRTIPLHRWDGLPQLKPDDVDAIVGHYSASDYGTAQTVDGWHRNRNWRGIGYHFLIGNGVPGPSNKYDPKHDGLIYEGRPLYVKGAHVKGHNDYTWGVCLIGNGSFTWKQLIALKQLMSFLRTYQRSGGLEYGPPWRTVYTHNDLGGKRCPGGGLSGAELRQLLFGDATP